MPTRTLAETATVKARETALAAKEKAKDLASQAQKKQYVWWAHTPGGDAVSGLSSTSEKGRVIPWMRDALNQELRRSNHACLDSQNAISEANVLFAWNSPVNLI